MARFRGRTWLFWVVPPLAALALLWAVWSWDWFIPLVEARASAKLGRPVSIAHLHVRPGRIAAITLEGVRIGNPPGFPDDPPFAVVPRATVELDLRALARDRSLVIPSVELDRPVVEVLGREDGSRNYDFDLGGSAGEDAAPGGPRIGALRINDGRAHVAIARLQADFAIEAHTQEATDRAAPNAAAEAGGAPQGAGNIVLTAKGTYAGQPISAQLHGGGILNLRDAEHPWPVDLRLENGPSHLVLKGTLQDPVKLRGADLRLQAAGPDLSLLTPLTGVPLPKTPPFELAGRLDYAAGRVRLQEATGSMGRTDLAGSVAVTTGGERPEVTAELASKRVDLADLAGLLGGTPGRASTPGQTPQQRAALARAEASPRLLPDTPFNLPKLNAADIHLRYRADRIEGRGMPFDRMETTLDIEGGVVTLHPITFGVGQGVLTGQFVLTPREDGALHAKGDWEARRLDVSRLLGAVGAGGAGTMGGVGQLDGTGKSVAQILGRADGAVSFVSVGGNVSSLLVDLSGLQFGNALLSALGIPSRTRIECLIADFTLRRGTLTSRTLLLDTDSSVVTGGGALELGRERLDLRLRTDAKHTSIGSLPTPIHLTGSLKDPSIQPEVGELAARGGAAVGLGLLLPPLAVLPLVQLGVGENNQCEALQSRGRRR